MQLDNEYIIWEVSVNFNFKSPSQSRFIRESARIEFLPKGKSLNTENVAYNGKMKGQKKGFPRNIFNFLKT